MSFASEASKLLTNKYFLYFIVFLSATNVLGYLVTNKTNAVIFFALVSLLTYQFSKNMAVILLVSVIATNFLMANKRMREGLENQTTTIDQTTVTEKAKDISSKVEGVDDQIASAIPAVQSTPTGEKVSEMTSKISSPTPVVDSNNRDLNNNIEADTPMGVGSNISKKAKNNENFGPRLDYAATIEQSYQNLDSILGSDSIKQLTNDTQNLMKQQENLFNTMNSMVPVLQGAQNLLKDFKIDGLANSLKGISGLANVPIASPST